MKKNTRKKLQIKLTGYFHSVSKDANHNRLLFWTKLFKYLPHPSFSHNTGGSYAKTHRCNS